MAQLLAWRYTLSTVFFVALGAVLLGTSIPTAAWGNLLPFFEWLETTPFGLIGKTWGASFALVEAVHLLGLALLGGALIVGDGRLAGFWLTSVEGHLVQANVQRLVTVAVTTLILTGVFMVCSVAVKVYYLEVFWYKMLCLLAGCLFFYGIRTPWVQRSMEVEAPWTSRAVAASNFLIWGSVGATGRWIGFSG